MKKTNHPNKSPIRTSFPRPTKSVTKALSLLLSFVMLFTITAGLDFSVYANESIMAGETKQAFIPDGERCAYFSFTPETDGTYNLTSDAEDDDTYVTLYDSNMNELASDDESGEGSNFSLFYDYKAGQTYIFECRLYSNNAGSFNVTLTEVLVASIEFTPVKPIEIVENTCGDWYENDDGKFYIYSTGVTTLFSVGDKLNVVDKEGNWVEYTYCEEYGHELRCFFRSDDGDEIPASSTEKIEINSNQWSEHWTLGSDNYFTISYMGKEVQVPVTIVENPVASIEFIPVKPIEIVENTNGSWQTDEETGEYFFEYDISRYIFARGNVLSVIDKDGNKTEYKYNNGNFFNSNGDEADVRYYENQWAKHWTLGSDNYFTVSYSDKEVQVPVTIIESPVVSIEYKTVKPIEILETSRVTFENLNNGDSFTVTYKDGTKKEYTHTDYQWCVSSDGEEIELDRIDYEKGNDYFTISYIGKSTQVPVTVISVNNEISKATYVPVKTQYYENMSGRYHRDGYYKYNLSFNKGDKLSFEYANGETESYTYIVENQNNEYREGFYSDKTGRKMPYYAQFKNNFSKTPWTVGKNTLNLTVYANEDGYKGEELIKTTADIELLGVKNIQFHLKDNEPYVLYEGVDSFIDEDENGIKYKYYATSYIINDKLDYALVTLSDGKQEKLNLLPYASEGELANDDFSMEIYLGNITMDDGQYENHWSIGNHKISYTYGDYSFEIPVKVVENPVVSIEYTPVKPYMFVENTNGYMDYDWEADEEYYYYETPGIAEGDVLTVTNKDGSKIEYTAKYVFSEDYNGYTYEFFDENGNKTIKSVWNTSNQSASNPWKLGSDNYVVVEYMGVTANVPVTIVQEGEVHTHSYTETITAPTCMEKGYTTYTCVCGDSYVDNYLNATGHTYDSGTVTKNATCAITGEKTYTCSVCSETKIETIPKTAHTNKTVITKATTGKNGSVVTKCSVCGTVSKNTVIYYPKTITLSKTSYAYNGKAQKPSVTVKDSQGKTLKNGTDYTVKYPSGMKNVGKYSVKITFKGNYSGTKTLIYTILPKSTTISKVTAGKKAFTVKWKKQATQTTGYQIQYSTDKNFKKNNKTVTISKNKTTSKKVTKLKAKKKYYVRVRTYKTVKVNGKNTKIYSGWSKVKTVKTK